MRKAHQHLITHCTLILRGLVSTPVLEEDTPASPEVSLETVVLTETVADEDVLVEVIA